MFGTVRNWLTNRRNGSPTHRPRPRSFVVPRPKMLSFPRWRSEFGLNAPDVCFTRCVGLPASGAMAGTSLSLAAPGPASHSSIATRGSTHNGVAPTNVLPSPPPHVLSLECERIIDDIAAGILFNRKLADFDPAPFLATSGRFVAWIQWGDGEISLGSLLCDQERWWVCGTHCYLSPGRYQARVTLSDGLSQAVTREVQMHVDEPIEVGVFPDILLPAQRDSLARGVGRWWQRVGSLGSAS